MNQIKLLLVDDHEIFLEGLSNLLGSVEGMEIVDIATNGLDALDYVRNNTYDVLLTDLSMPQMSGIELVKKVKEEFPNQQILVLTMHDDRPTISEIIMAEAEGYVLKNTSKRELVQAIYKIHEGGTYYANEVMSVLLERLQGENKKMEAMNLLTDRELEVLDLIAKEKSSKEIAEMLHISIMTVDTHRKNLLKKTGKSSVIGLLKFGVHHQLISL